MPIPVEDPGFLGAIIGAVSGLVGAALGGAISYYASLVQYRTEHGTRQNSALAAALIEICRNQSLLILELDRALPLWLSRCYDRPSARQELHDITCPIQKCETRVYDIFFSELIPSPYGPELKTYYDRVGHINKLSEAHADGLPPEKFSSYIRAVALSVEIADELAAALQQHVSRVLAKSWGKEDDFGGLADGRSRALYMVALYRTKLSDLESFIADCEACPTLPRLIREGGKELLDSWVIPARALTRRW